MAGRGASVALMRLVGWLGGVLSCEDLFTKRIYIPRGNVVFVCLRLAKYVVGRCNTSSQGCGFAHCVFGATSSPG